MVKIISCLVEIVDELLKEDAFDPFRFSDLSSEKDPSVPAIVASLLA